MQAIASLFFGYFSSFSNNGPILTTNGYEKLFVQYPDQGFKLKTSSTLVSFCKYNTKAPVNIFFVSKCDWMKHRKQIYQNACPFYNRKKIVSAFLQIFQLMLGQNIISKYISVTQNQLGGDIHEYLFFITQIHPCHCRKADPKNCRHAFQ